MSLNICFDTKAFDCSSLYQVEGMKPVLFSNVIHVWKNLCVFFSDRIAELVPYCLNIIYKINTIFNIYSCVFRFFLQRESIQMARIQAITLPPIAVQWQPPF